MRPQRTAASARHLDENDVLRDRGEAYAYKLIKVVSIVSAIELANDDLRKALLT